MKYWSILLLALLLPISSNTAFSSELKQHTGIIHEIRTDYISLKPITGGQINIGFVCEPEVCDSTTNYSIGDEVLADFGSAEREGLAGRVNKLVSIRICLDSDPECINVAEEAIKAKELGEIESKKFLKLYSTCLMRMGQALEADDRYIADTWVTRIRRLTTDRNVDYDDLDRDESTNQCVDTIFRGHHDAVMEMCERHGCGDGIGGGCAHIAGYGGTDALRVHATKQCLVK